MASRLPIKFTELLQLSSLGVQTAAISFNSCVSSPTLTPASHLWPFLTFADIQTIESDHYICLRDQKDETSSPEVVIVDLKNGNSVNRRTIKADHAIMHWTRQVIALKASRNLQIFDLDQKVKLKSTTTNEDVVFWKWISESTIGLVTETSVSHWDVFDPNQPAPVKVFDRNANLTVCLPFPSCASGEC